MDNTTTNSNFSKNRTTIIIIIVIILLIGVSFWIWNVRNAAKRESDLEALIRATTASGPETITPVEKQQLVQNTSAATTTSNVSNEDLENLINAMSAK